MRPSILGLLVIALFAPACAPGGESDAPIRLTLAWTLVLDAQGHVERMTAIPDQRADRVPQIRARLEQEIRGWDFVSGTVDGRSAATETVLSATVTLQPAAADSFRVVFDDVRTGGRIAKAVPPKYPLASVKQHETGMVVLRVDYDADGKVRSARVDPDSPTVAQRLIDASLAAVNQWTFQPERVGGHGVAGTQSLPVCFALSPVGSRRPVPPCAWNPPGRHAPVGEGQSVALHPAARLVNDVAGHAL
jgi:TonB family protein